jgi:peptide/nickel transport system permease protein
MLRYALRRVLWLFPTLVAVSIVTFLFLSFVPDPTDDPTVAESFEVEALRRHRRERFLDLPRFLNPAPRDVRVRAEEAVLRIAAGGEDAPAAGRELARLGGAALPHVLPSLDALSPEPRTRVALALAPVAARMGLPDAERAGDPATAVAFWTRFWDDRSIEFRDAGVRTAVERLARYRSASRADDLRKLDTFALAYVLGDLSAPTNNASLERARVLVDIAAHATGVDDRIDVADDLDAARACVERWKKFWSIYGSDYVELQGASRVAAVVLDTRYGKWAMGAVTQRFGTSVDGTPALDRLSARAPITLFLVFGALAMAYALGIVLGSVSAASRGRKTDLAVAVVVLALYAAPTAVVAVLVARATDQRADSILLPTLVLALGLLAAPTRQQRASLANVMSQDYIRTAIAKGASRTRAVVIHGLRNALLPVVTLATLEAPFALGGAFVVEHVFELPGLGDATILAVEQRDISWLMAISIFAAAVAAVGVIATELSYAAIDPRLKLLVLSGRRRR